MTHRLTAPLLTRRTLLVAVLAVVMSAPLSAYADTDDLRTIVVREGKTATLLDGGLTIQVIKLRGYAIDVRIDGVKQALKIGQSFAPNGAACQVTFQKISPETQIARFKTDCP